MAQIENLPLVLTGLGLTASILYYTMTLRNANKTQQMQLFLRIYQDWTSEDWLLKHYKLIEQEWESVDDYMTKYDTTGDIANRARVMGVLNGIGLAVREGYIDLKLVYDYGGYGIVGFWEKFKEILLYEREKYNRPDLYVGIEYISGKLIGYRVKLGVSTDLLGLDKKLGRF
jgi:hypothetical protein